MEKFYEDIYNSSLETIIKNGKPVGIRFKKTGIKPLDWYKNYLLWNTYNGLCCQHKINKTEQISLKKVICDLEQEEELKNKMWTSNQCATIIGNIMNEWGMKPPLFETKFCKSFHQSMSIQLCAFRNWFKYKQIYRFDTDFFNYINEGDNNEKIPTSILKTALPCGSFYIDNTFKAGSYEADGCIVCIDFYDNSTGLLFYFDGKTINGEETDIFQYGFIPLDIGDKSVNELLNEKCVENVLVPENNELRNQVNNLISQALKCVIYMCASNKEVEVRTPRSPKENYDYNQSIKKAKAMEVKINQEDVGFRIGNAIRQHRIIYESNPNVEHHTGSPKTPHLRSGHYHSFWTGKKDGSEERKLIIKFLPPVFVGTNKKEITPTIHKIVDKKL